jgi:Zn ribbon nucleic-acid-binding protein
MKYCRLCLQPDTRPGIRFDAGGTCPACVYAASLKGADWEARQKELQEIVAFGPQPQPLGLRLHHRGERRQGQHPAGALRERGSEDESAPGLPRLSAGARSPSEVVENVSNLIKLGFDCVSINPGPQTWRKLMRRSFLEHANWCKSTELALFSSVPRLAIAYQIPLIWWGENAALQLGDLNVAGRAGWDGNNLRRHEHAVRRRLRLARLR